MVASVIPEIDDEAAPANTSARSSQRWMKPHTGWVKANIDAAFNVTTGAGFGLVLRDETGALVAAATFQAGHQLDAAVSEALYLRWAIQLCKNLNCKCIQFETDGYSILQSWD